MTLELNIFNLQTKPSSFDELVEDSVFDEEFDDTVAAEYESFLMDDGPKYNEFEFDDFDADCLIAFTSRFAYESDSPPAFLELKPLLDCLKYLFFGT